jgi:hypothetical protein
VHPFKRSTIKVHAADQRCYSLLIVGLLSANMTSSVHTMLIGVLACIMLRIESSSQGNMLL